MDYRKKAKEAARPGRDAKDDGKRGSVEARYLLLFQIMLGMARPEKAPIAQ